MAAYGSKRLMGYEDAHAYWRQNLRHRHSLHAGIDRAFQCPPLRSKSAYKSLQMSKMIRSTSAGPQHPAFVLARIAYFTIMENGNSSHLHVPLIHNNSNKNKNKIIKKKRQRLFSFFLFFFFLFFIFFFFKPTIIPQQKSQTFSTIQLKGCTIAKSRYRHKRDAQKGRGGVEAVGVGGDGVGGLRRRRRRRRRKKERNKQTKKVHRNITH